MPNGLVHPDISHRGRQHRGYDQRCLDAWQQLLAETADNGHFVTLGFSCYLDLERAIHTANHFLCRMNRRLFGKCFRRRGNSLEGMVVLEEKQHSSRSSNSPHFHFVLKPDVAFDTEMLRKAAKREAGRLCFPTRERRRPFGPAISGADFVHVDDPYTLEQLAQYLTKNCDRFAPMRDALNIGFVSLDGIEGLSAIGLDRSRDLDGS